MTFETSLSEAVEFGLADAKKQKNILTNSLAREQFVSALSILLESKTIEHTELLRSTAKQIRDEECGKRLILRGLVEFSSYCVNDCRYCGLNRTNTKATRYRLSEDEILKAARSIHASGISTIVLQSGEDKTSAAYLTSIITRIKTQYPLAITLSVGEKTTDEFAEWKKAGADRYLMRVESSNPELYKNLHIGRRVESRIDCLKTLKVQDWQVGSGIMIGPPGQTIAHIAQDILFFAEHNFDMIGIGPFIPHPDTVFHSEKTGNIELSLNSVALTRIITRNTWLPATTAIASLEKDYRLDALNSGANVIMPSFTPQRVRKNYEIYPGKHCFEESNAQCIKELAALATRAGLSLDLSRADTLKTHSNMKIP